MAEAVAIRILRVYHGGRDQAHRARERALVEAGLEVTLVVPDRWPNASSEPEISPEPFRVVELAVRRAGDVNRHAYVDPRSLSRLVAEVRPDVLDIHEEPFSVAMRQSLAAVPAALPVVGYTAQNIDKRYPPPYCLYEASARRRLAALYPCSRQAASVARGKGFGGLIEVIPLGYDPTLFRPGEQSPDAGEVVLGFVGRLVPEKGSQVALEVLAALNRARPARLVVLGSGPDEWQLLECGERLGVGDRVTIQGWGGTAQVAELLRATHVLLVPSLATPSWAEQFGRVILEAQASGALVAGFASGAIPEVAGEPGLLAPEGDTAGLARLVTDVLADAGEWRMRRVAGLELASARTWARVVQRQAALYERARESQSKRSARVRGGRTAARAEFGPTASTPLGSRPFALPGFHGRLGRRLLPGHEPDAS